VRHVDYFARCKFYTDHGFEIMGLFDRVVMNMENNVFDGEFKVIDEQSSIQSPDGNLKEPDNS
jgi:hypothetical protein